MDNESKIKELQKTIEKASEQIKELQNESNDDRWISKSPLYKDRFIITKTKEAVEDIKMPMIKVHNNTYGNQNDFRLLNGSDDLNLAYHLNKLDKMYSGIHNVYLHIEKVE
jgi:hypothetical protein